MFLHIEVPSKFSPDEQVGLGTGCAASGVLGAKSPGIPWLPTLDIPQTRTQEWGLRQCLLLAALSSFPKVHTNVPLNAMKLA